MSDADDRFAKTTDSLIALYRGVERSTLDLPLVSFMPMLIFLWAFLRFYFFFIIGIFLIIPVNLVILIRNIFPGHWRYRSFFLHHLYYCLIWIWRGEAITAPTIFVRPLLTIFMKGHFERRLRRLRLEVLDSDLSDTTRSALLGRLDASIERWKAPRLAGALYTVVLPAIISLPTWYKEFIDFLGSLGIHMPTDVVANFIPKQMSPDSLLILGLLAPGYLLAFPVTAFLAKRGLFIGINPDGICFPGGQGGAGIYYSKEREILDSVGLRVREAPIDLWLLGISLALGWLVVLAGWNHWIAFMQSVYPDKENLANQMLVQGITQSIVAVLSVSALFVAAVRRQRTGRV
jgi:hypothetical protein